MPLIEKRPEVIAPDCSQRETIIFKSQVDGCELGADIYSHISESDHPQPLVIAPHPITWTAVQDYHEGNDGLMREYHCGYYGLAAKYGVIIVMPHGHHHKEDLCSLAGPEQIEDLIFLADRLPDYGYQVDKERVYACGLSMGGQEALVAAGKHPDKFAAICVFNPIVDLGAWYEDLANSPIPEIKEYDTALRIANEVGCIPSEFPSLYAERSATNYVEGLSRVPTLIFWSEQDLIVPRQISHHSYLLCHLVKELTVTSPIAEYNHTKIHGPLEFDLSTRWQLHEWCDYELALRWLLCHKKWVGG
jgi:hypothetical protein